MKKRSIKNLALNKRLISNFEIQLTGGLVSDSKTGGCNTISLILECPEPEPITKDMNVCPGPSPITNTTC